MAPMTSQTASTTSLKQAVMNQQKAVAIGWLKAETDLHHPQSFLTKFDDKIELAFPPVQIPGALPGTGLGWNAAPHLHMYVDLVTLWGFGDFDESLGCSKYYDPNSEWYNGFYGAYAMRSYKSDGKAWGYTGEGKADFKQFFKITEVDYNFLTAASFACPPEKMCFRVKDFSATQKDGWDVVTVTADAPSGLHDPAKARYAPDPTSYLVFGLPHPGLLNGGDSFAPVELTGKFYMKQWPSLSEGRPVSIAWGAAFHNTAAGQAQLEQTMAVMEAAYLDLGKGS